MKEKETTLHLLKIYSEISGCLLMIKKYRNKLKDMQVMAEELNGPKALRMMLEESYGN